MKKTSRQRRKKLAVVSDELIFSLSDHEEDRTPVSVVTEKLSADGRRILRQHGDLNLCTESETPNTDTDLANEFVDLATIDLDAVSESIKKANGRSTGEESRKKRYISSDQPFKNWVPHRPEFLDELLRGEGRSFTDSHWCITCTDGKKREAIYRCEDCFELTDFKDQCVECVIVDHARSPFHRIKKWNGSYFEKVTLQSLGLTIQLGHKQSEKCAHPIPARSKMVVLHTNGIHPTSINYCGCDRAEAAGNVRQQLMRNSLYPATEQDPMTCSTFTLLETTHIQNVQSKSGVYDLYMALERLTDNTGLRSTRVRHIPGVGCIA
ncbi:hypothetical protein EIP86_010684 [Pleurotus ostreatoroseus]|nr:hypothetical protein EIP86_010684 [Pleurotus ostreatoroseus]